MFKKAGFIAAMLALSLGAFAQKPTDLTTGAVIWEPGDISSRNVYLGPAADLQPEFKDLKYIGRQPGGNSPKYRIIDGNGVEWIAKAAEESQPEVAATRLLWAVGYKTEIDSLAPRLEIAKVGTFSNVRMEARPKNIKRGDRWSWMENPFSKSRELDGLKIMMALINNWDLKDENTVILRDGGKNYYVVSDLGASFGKLADKSFSRAGRSVNDPEDYAASPFVKSVDAGMILFNYNGMSEHIMRGITVENARWMADLLLQLNDKQIEDAFRAANYKPEKIAIYRDAVKARIKALDEATKPAEAPATSQ